VDQRTRVVFSETPKDSQATAAYTATKSPEKKMKG
jgi:hypothetical protein